MKAKQIKLFENQPELDDSHIANLTKRGFLVPEFSIDTGERRDAKLRNKHAGEVVSYQPLDAALRGRTLGQDDARRLLAIEAARTTSDDTRRNGHPRWSHINRLIILAFATDKSRVLDRISQISNAK
tara:strand:+ start:5574 stop:5954 length:381 start_codon:yes stop_codon:yes gene_type:complete